jgi:2-polyprenyl-3-methyl-5-hydroxy-6-metoxy-1,4-benzoquinol methylase
VKESSVSTSQESLEEIAHNYHLSESVPDLFIENICQRHSLAWLLSRLSPGGRVLELGYGDGIVTGELIRKGHAVTLIEGSRSLAEKAAREHGSRLTVRHSLFEAFRTGDAFDSVVATHVLEHVADPVDLLRRIRGWLAPDGKAVIVVPNRESLHRRLAVEMGLQPELDTLGERDRLVGHRRVYSLETLRRDVEEAGLEVTDEHGFFLKVLPNSMMLGFSPALIEALNVVGDLLPARFLANLGVVACRAG